jgi:K+-sensing histidine kinase KdpD
MNFEVSPDDYFAEIAQRAVLSMQGRYIIIRMIDDDPEKWNLSCIAVEDQIGLLDQDVRLYDIGHDSPHRSVYEAVERRFLVDKQYLTIITRQTHPDIFEQMTQGGTEGIQSIVISPLTLGLAVKGFINVGYDTFIDLNDYMRLTFATVFNNICIAIENFQKLNELTNLRNLKVRDFIEHLHIDLLQGFRHSAHTALLAAHIAHRKMIPFYQYKGDPKTNPAASVQAHLEMAEVALESMASLRAYAEGKTQASVLDAFKGAVELLKTQIDEAGVSVVPNASKGESLEALINFEAVRSAFANLILNSLQAMKASNTPKADRRIRVTFKKERGTIFIDYADTGPGVRVPSGDIRTYEDIWIAGKTSKKSGTGYGLPMVREVFQGLHNGSIDLWSSTRGAHFKIVLRDGLE